MLRPNHTFQSLADAVPTLLAQDHLRGVLVDLDNTLVPYGQDEIPDATREAVEKLRRHLDVVLISNNRNHRVQQAAGRLEVAFVGNAMKPFPWGFRAALKLLNRPAGEVAMVGDQLMTDVLGANAVGMVSVLVNPQAVKDFPATKIFRAMEAVFLRLLGLSRKTFPTALPPVKEEVPRT